MRHRGTHHDKVQVGKRLTLRRFEGNGVDRRIDTLTFGRYPNETIAQVVTVQLKTIVSGFQTIKDLTKVYG